MMIKKKKKLKFLFLILFISVLNRPFQKFLYRKAKMTQNCKEMYTKIHEAPASTANAPLLNLNLNYEKLQCKVTYI